MQASAFTHCCLVRCRSLPHREKFSIWERNTQIFDWLLASRRMDAHHSSYRTCTESYTCDRRDLCLVLLFWNVHCTRVQYSATFSIYFWKFSVFVRILTLLNICMWYIRLAWSSRTSSSYLIPIVLEEHMVRNAQLQRSKKILGIPFWEHWILKRLANVVEVI